MSRLTVVGNGWSRESTQDFLPCEFEGLVNGAKVASLHFFRET